jgi:hypothetical protein
MDTKGLQGSEKEKKGEEYNQTPEGTDKRESNSS